MHAHERREAPLDNVLARLQRVARNGEGWAAQYPAHEDRNPSLSIHVREGKILLHCHAGCSVETICAALGIELRELFVTDGSAPRVVAEYDYTDEMGKLLYQVIRFDPKDFRQRRPDGNARWISNLNGVRRVLYRLPEVLKARYVIVVEGEKDAETARKLSRVATTKGVVSAKWLPEYSEALRGKRIVIIPDADEPGRQDAQQHIAPSLAGKVESLKVLELPGSKDLTEWIERGGTREARLELVRNASEWKPGSTDQGTRIVLVTADEFLKRTSQDERQWLADGLLPASSQTIWQGRPKVGKSHSLLQLAFDLACGLPAFGHFPVQRPVRCAYVELEEPEGITKARYVGILRGHGSQGPNAENLVFFTREDLWRLGFLPRELSGTARKTLFPRYETRGLSF